MKVLRRKRRMIGLPLFALFLSSAAVFYGGMWVSEKRASFSLRRLPTGFSLRRNCLPNYRTARTRPGHARREPGPDLRNADEALRTAEIHIRESEMAAQKAAERQREGQPVETEVSEIDFPPDTEARPRLDLSNSTEAVADDEPVQGLETIHPNKFAVEAHDKVWIQVKIDDKETRSAMLHPGDRKEWAADKVLQVVVGNAGGIHMKWNGQHKRLRGIPDVFCASGCPIMQRRSRLKYTVSAGYL